jgi:uncharacterized protein Veg
MDVSVTTNLLSATLINTTTHFFIVTYKYMFQEVSHIMRDILTHSSQIVRTPLA